MADSRFWKSKKVLVTGVSFIVSHLVDRLVKMGADVRVVNISDKHQKQSTGILKLKIKTLF